MIEHTSLAAVIDWRVSRRKLPRWMLRSRGERRSSADSVVVASSAALTLLLPFYEVTAEIEAHTSPTALDLLVVIFCAIATAYAAVRPGSDTSSTAEGTAIGIALVPPLYVVGYEIGPRAQVDHTSDSMPRRSMESDGR